MLLSDASSPPHLGWGTPELALQRMNAWERMIYRVWTLNVLMYMALNPQHTSGALVKRIHIVACFRTVRISTRIKKSHGGDTVVSPPIQTC